MLKCGPRCEYRILAIVTFKDEDGEYSVFKHFDGYPSELLKIIEEAKKYAWPLPRFEANEFSGAFVVAAKNETIRAVDKAGYGTDYGGGVRLVGQNEIENWDVDYHYLVECINGQLVVEYMEETEKHGNRLERVKL